MDWKTLLAGALIGAIIAFPFGIFGNLATPWVKSYVKKRKLSTRDRKFFVVLSRYRELREFEANPTVFILWVLWLMTMAILISGVLIMLAGGGLLASNLASTYHATGNEPNSYLPAAALCFVAFSFFLMKISQIADTLTDVMKFSEFRTKTLAKLIKLGGNPTELDKIDKEIEEKQGGYNAEMGISQS